MQKKVNKISFKGQRVYIGIDVHLKSWTITIIVEDVIYKSFSQDPNVRVLKNYLENKFPDATYFSVYEAGFCGF